MPLNRKIELLAPARNYASAQAAIDWGADAVYIGATGFGARHAAGNTVGDIARVIDYARPYGVRVYATLNTLLFENELHDAELLARELIGAGVDALIVQDMAYLEMGLTGVEFHASTQVFNASVEKVRFLEGAGFSRVILERGMPFSQIEEISSATDVGLECFVHGAICVGYSGQCWLSRSMGDRSGNRGQCSQPCRQTYDLVDGSGKVLIKGKHLLSVRDLDLSRRLGEMIDGGVTSFKIEGRLKDMDYVKNTVGFYRRRLDQEIALRPGLRRASSGVSVTDVNTDLSKTFTRGRSEYFFDGPCADVASFDTPKAIGEHIGKIIRVAGSWLEIDTSETLAAGDGICFFSGGELMGTNVTGVEGNQIKVNKTAGLSSGTDIYRNYDHSFSSRLASSRTRRVIAAGIKVSLHGNTLVLDALDADGNNASLKFTLDAEPARDQVKAKDTLVGQLSKSGDTIFRIDTVDVVIEEPILFIRVAEINSMRRAVLDKLLQSRLALPPVRNYGKQDSCTPYISKAIDGYGNVTNSLAERFYSRHGVEHIARGFDLHKDLSGVRVMRTPYCIRREIGECLKEKSRLKGPLRLEHGTLRYRLEFDCERCEMALVFEGG